MAIYKYYFILIIAAVVNCEDRFHPRPANIAPKASEFKNIDPLYKNVEGHNVYWNSEAQKYLENQLKLKKNTKIAKNVILFIGDGLSISTTAATRMYIGGEEKSLSYEEFPYYGLAKTYNANKQVADSASTASALMTGVKATDGAIGLTGNVSSSQCDFSDDDVTYSIVKWAQDSGKGTGLVTTTTVTHATPSPAYAHSPSRFWESDASIPAECKNSPTSRIIDIATQFVYNEEGKRLKVYLGGGTKNLLDRSMKDDEGNEGVRTDGKNLIKEWLNERNKVGKAEYVWHKGQLDVVDYQNTDFLLGLFDSDNMMYRLEILEKKLEAQEPQLTDMTEAAIKMLQKEKNGYFLMVEGGRIDHAHHPNQARLALDETAEFSRAIDLARRMTSEEDTLIVVTADHSHVVTYSGYPARHSDVLKTAGEKADDEKPYEVLSYGNGPGYANTWNQDGSRRDITNDDFTDIERVHSAVTPRVQDTHAGEDVGVYASGPWSHLFVGSYENTDIAWAMAYAAKIGPFAEVEEGRVESTTTEKCVGKGCGDSANGINVMPLLILISLIIVYFS